LYSISWQFVTNISFPSSRAKHSKKHTEPIRCPKTSTNYHTVQNNIPALKKTSAFSSALSVKSLHLQFKTKISVKSLFVQFKTAISVKARFLQFKRKISVKSQLGPK
jgi:hypothetical protein